jgi:mannose-6-phosphate isomerase-like protein (cupin superfamily)
MDVADIEYIERATTMSKAINIDECFTTFTDTFSPKIVAELNGQHIKLVRVKGDKVPWHTHDNEDEMFYVLDGVLDVLTRDETVEVNANEFYIVPKGVEHKVIARGDVRLMLFEPAGIEHTGKVRAEITKDHDDWLDL